MNSSSIQQKILTLHMYDSKIEDENFCIMRHSEFSKSGFDSNFLGNVVYKSVYNICAGKSCLLCPTTQTAVLSSGRGRTSSSVTSVTASRTATQTYLTATTVR
jgi:hypothetical protein